MNTKKGLIYITLFFMIFWFTDHSAIISGYINDLKVNQNSLSVSQTQTILDESSLLEKIKQAAVKKKIEPIDARIDRVWKAIPGYNGKEVDIEKTLHLAKTLRSDEIPFVFYEVEPNIQLEDLEPQPIYKGNPNKKMVSIMVNVSWGTEYLPSILKTFESENVHSTFFLDGKWINNNVEVAKNIKELGHELSNHAYSHKDMSELGRKEAIDEMVKTQELLTKLFNVDNQLFAPPSGDFDQETVQLAHELNLKTIMWTIDTVDWKKPTPDYIIKKISSKLEPGALILMHPTKSSSEALPELIKLIKQNGYVLGTVSDLISSKRINEVESHFNF
ncbi:polysaccharide deacetylase family protein [Chengkuizengella axinellae]|uniref:Polysaccharide deacetylase family protein n=1 Tax=Chengkuizengella axinellae TaxID=3064388 RepID=A0ABT9IVU9_9BACL|nr:polysaccharide deacetylase family protein [Chengkuizengella sp. 2205SS18-9]MDP5273490.1 polysaccharide deacetylase family protein [Chengkuizengella sp. 2205SS18-9]